MRGRVVSSPGPITSGPLKLVHLGAPQGCGPVTASVSPGFGARADGAAGAVRDGRTYALGPSRPVDAVDKSVRRRGRLASGGVPGRPAHDRRRTTEDSGVVGEGGSAMTHTREVTDDLSAAEHRAIRLAR